MPRNIKFLTYNIDGLNEDSLAVRLEVLLALIISENADIIHLQEVVPAISESLTRTLFNNGYTCSESVYQQRESLGRYFTLSFVRHRAQERVSFRRETYTGAGASQQGRDMLITTIVPKDSKGSERDSIVTINTHGESCGTAFKSAESDTRRAQLLTGLKVLKERDGPALLAGDLNIRDTEASYVLKSLNSPSVVDVAMEKETKPYQVTWRMPNNNSSNEESNSGKPNGRRFAGCRFDRVYVNKHWKIVSYKLIGQDAVFEGLGFTYDTPSDHFGIVCEFSLEGMNDLGAEEEKITSVCEEPSSKRRKTSNSIITIDLT